MSMGIIMGIRDEKEKILHFLLTRSDFLGQALTQKRTVDVQVLAPSSIKIED